MAGGEEREREENSSTQLSPHHIADKSGGRNKSGGDFIKMAMASYQLSRT
jgi:hypothetical protein